MTEKKFHGPPLFSTLPRSHTPTCASCCPQGAPSGLAVMGGWVGPLPGGGTWLICSFTCARALKLEEEKAALLGRQRQVEQEASWAREEQERLEQLQLEREVERQGLEGSLRVAEHAREALEHQLPTLRQERCRLQEQLAQVGVGEWGQLGKGSCILSWGNSQAQEPDSEFKSSPTTANWELWASYPNAPCFCPPISNGLIALITKGCSEEYICISIQPR